MDFEAYLISKKIDSALFLKEEGDVWNVWKYEFEQMHPNSFTSQKLYLINPVRRKYPLKDIPVVKKEDPAKSPLVNTEIVATEIKTDPIDGGEVQKPDAPKPLTAKPAVPRPVFKPKPKTT